MSSANLIEDSLRPLTAPEYSFIYRYSSGSRQSKGQIHDWEVQAAYRTFQEKYQGDALNVMKRLYQDEMVKHNLHLFLGTMKAHPKQFTIVGVLRFSGEAGVQPPLF
jgi:hypothetical protein